MNNWWKSWETGKQCQNRRKLGNNVVQKLKNFVNSTKNADKNKESGQGRTKWKFFDKLN